MWSRLKSYDPISLKPHFGAPHSSARVSPAQFAAVKKELGLAREKGKGKGKDKRERAPTQLALPVASATEDLLQLGFFLSEEGWQNYKTVDKIGKKPVCLALNDGRGCSKWCPQSRQHRCDRERFAARASIPVLPTTRGATVHRHSGID